VQVDGTRIVIHLLPGADGTVTEARFQAYGCPHTLAAVAWLVSRLPGRTVQDLQPGTPADWARELQVPVEKLGQLLLLEDALLAVRAKWPEKAVPARPGAT
jgi:NifU-like protein involved in Fe-S cluster formation